MSDTTINREEFFRIFSISEEYFESTGLDWDELMKIYLDYLKLVPYLEKEAEHIVSKLIDSIGVHSVRRRVKKAAHLVEKIIRKGRKYSDRGICLEN
ncbi:MAG: GTP pyrophosphokinase, partial [Cetobacterium sp.]